MIADEERKDVSAYLRNPSICRGTRKGVILSPVVGCDAVIAAKNIADSLYVSNYIASLIEREDRRTCVPVLAKKSKIGFEDFYFVECSECGNSLGTMFFDEREARHFTESLPTSYLRYCQKCGAKVRENDMSANMGNEEKRKEVSERLKILASHREVDREMVEDALGLYMGECVDGYDPVSVMELADLIYPHCT